jgi:hypothetical protein
MNVAPFAGYCTKKQDSVRISYIYSEHAPLLPVCYKIFSGDSESRSRRRVRIQTTILIICFGTVSTVLNIHRLYKFFLIFLGTASGNSKQGEGYRE